MLRALALGCTLLLTTGCSSLGYYAHVARGQAALLLQRQSIAKLVADPATDPTLRRRLEAAWQARLFASTHLGLPRNGSYASYVELGRPYVTWNVFAAPEFAVEPVTRCFPFAGCVAYQGYFDRARADDAAGKLAAEGDDVQVEGTVAYSTLGFFADPVLSSMLRWSDDELAATIFHELAHQALYVEDDSAFNESYATFVGEQGLREWRASRALPPPDERDRAEDDAFAALVLDLRERLRAVYATEATASEKRAAKRVEIEAFRERYRQARDRDWRGDRRYDAWVAAPLNNASLLPFGLYDRWVGAFAQVFEHVHGDWSAFFTKCRALARQPKARRDDALRRLQAEGGIADTATERADVPP